MKPETKIDKLFMGLSILTIILLYLFALCSCAGMPPSQKILVNRMIETADVLDTVPVETESGEYAIPDEHEDGMARLIKENAETARQLRGYLDEEAGDE